MKKYVDYCQKLKEGKGFGSQFLAGGGEVTEHLQ